MESSFAFKHMVIPPPLFKTGMLARSGLLCVALISSVTVVVADPLTSSNSRTSLKPHIINIKNGEKLYAELSCSMCHPGGENSSAPERPIKGEQFKQRFPDNESLAVFIRKGRLEKGMPSFGKDVVSDGNLADLIAYIRSLSSSGQARVKLPTGPATKSAKKKI